MPTPVLRYCVRCNDPFATWSWCEHNLYCSDECNFFHHVASTDPDICWEWTGTKNKKGYGCVGSEKSAHRFSYRFHKGDIEKGKVIRHLCNNPGCVNPEHLEQGSYQDNMDDRKVAGTIKGNPGESNGGVKLKDEQVKVIFTSGQHPKILAQRFNISVARVRDILSGRGWNHITGAPAYVPATRYKKRVKNG